jgi:hypothetical protein
MASFILRRIFQRSFSQTSFQHAMQRQIIQEDGKLILKKFFFFILLMNDVEGISLKKENNTPTVIDDPLQHDDYFNVRSMVTLEDLFK